MTRSPVESSILESRPATNVHIQCALVDVTPTVRDTSRSARYLWLMMAFDCVSGQCPAYFHDVCGPVKTLPLAPGYDPSLFPEI